MGTRVPVQANQQYNLRSVNSYISTTSLHDLNTVDARSGEIIDRMVEVDRDANAAVPDDSLDNDDDSSAVECMNESYRNSLPLHSVGADEDRSTLENTGSSRDPYYILTIDDISPLEKARSRFLDIIVDHFISSHVTEATDSEVEYIAESAQDNLNKRKSREVRYEGDARFVLPLMYVANLYETLVNEVNMRISTLNGMHEKSISVALEAAGGLYRKLAKKFPRKGDCVFKRRELATSFETRSRFPELVIQEEKRVRFVVVNGLDIDEKPNNMHVDDAEWFKRLTGRSEVAVSARDYKFYAPRHKYRRLASNSVSSMPSLPAFRADNSSPISTVQSYRSISEPQNQQLKQHMHNLSHQGQFHHVNQNQSMNQGQHTSHFTHHNQCGPPSHLPGIAHTQQSDIPQHITCLQSLGHLGGRLHVMPASPAKFCDECGAAYLRETSKFCSECGFKRLGMGI